MAKKRLFQWLTCVAFMYFLMPYVMASVQQTNPGAIVSQAFNLRMAGQADEALAVLKQSASEDPSNALVQYELSRSYYHKGLGMPQDLEAMLKDAQLCIEKAIESAPANVICHKFSGHVAFMRGYLHMHLKGDKLAAKTEFEKALEAFKSVVRLDPANKVALLYLVELYGDLPTDVGGSKAMAETYARPLEDVDAIFAAKASAILSPKDAAFWQDILERHPGDAEVLEELGKAHLRENRVDAAIACFEDAVKHDPQKAYLFLDLSIYHTFSAMRARQDQGLFRENVASGDAAVARYLSSNLVQPMQAYALGVQSKYKSFSGDRDLGQSMYKKAQALDPYFSKATGAPLPDLFIPPKEMSKHHRYLMRPF